MTRGIFLVGLLVCGGFTAPGVIAADPLVTIENDAIKVGIQLASGGAIAWFSAVDSPNNLINSYDHGRLVQQSYYGASDDSLWNGKPWRWNPVQGGDWQGTGAPVLAQEISPQQIYVKTRPRHWARGDELTDCIMEQWITLDQHVAKVRYRFHYTGSQSHPPAHQELPAVFVAPEYSNLVHYAGTAPWTADSLARSTPGWPNESRKITEHWAAYVDENDYGLGVFVPVASEITCYRFPAASATSKDACSYFAPIKTFAITPGLTWEYEVYLTIGKVADMRQRFERLNDKLLANLPSVNLQLDLQSVHDLTATVQNDGSVQVLTTGKDPFIRTAELSSDYDAAAHVVLEFEYFSLAGTDSLQVFAVPPESPASQLTAPGISISEGWSRYTVDLQGLLAGAKKPLKRLRLDLGSRPDRTISFRNLRLRTRSEKELSQLQRAKEIEQQEEATTSLLRTYLDTDFPARIVAATVNETTVQVTGMLPGENREYVLAEVPVGLEFPAIASVSYRTPLAPNSAGDFSLTLPRTRKGPSGAHDRVLSRFAIGYVEEGRLILASAMRYPELRMYLPDVPEALPRNRKGLGGLTPHHPLSDLDDLGVSAVTVNISVGGILSSQPTKEGVPFEYAGKTWFANLQALQHTDQAIREAARRNLMVSAILLLPHAKDFADKSLGKMVTHPDADPAGIFVMPNLTEENGATAYAAIVHFLAQRYAPGSEIGRIHHWIMHNEVDAGWQWTNAGKKSALHYLDLYHRSMRTVHQTIRQFDPHAKTFISLTHHWGRAGSPRFYPGRELLSYLLEFSQKEGDFDWGIAFHPYPQNLGNPRTWEDPHTTEDFDTPCITFRNLEVLDRWVQQPQTFFNGLSPRTVHLSEQGLNSRGYTPAALREQAAGMAYAWKKLEPLRSISMFHYHNWVDNRHEGGLQIGLRKFRDDPNEPLGKKPIWHVFQALETEAQERAIAFALEVIGIKEWDEIKPQTVTQ